MIRNSIIKIVSLLLIIGLNWTGLSAVIETIAYYNDKETSSGNSYAAGTLDFSLNSPSNFSPSVTPTATSSRNINLVNNGSLGFQYTVQASNATGTLCSYLNLAANLDDNQVYNATLNSFTYNVDEFSTNTDDWQFTATLTSNDLSLENQTCNFDFIFNGLQIGGIGFSDQEIISNTITSGAWAEPTPPTTFDYSPIADSYVDQRNPGSNYGNRSKLEISSKNCPVSLKNRRIFIEFDFNFPSGTIINSASLKLYMKDAPSVSRIYEARRVLANWKERNPGGINWNNQPGAAATPTASVLSGTTSDVWLSWDVTSDVQGFVAAPSTNHGWRLSDSVENSSIPYKATFHSRESSSADKRPILEITFTPPAVTTDYPVINEVYYDVGSGKGNDSRNEWVEIYNPTDSEINISGWRICELSGCDIIPATPPIPAKGFAVVSGESSTWGYWTIIPIGVIKIDLPGTRIGSNGLRDAGDRVILRDASDKIIDAMSYGDDNSQLNPSVSLSGRGRSLARIIKGYDTNSAFDWVINATPNPGTNPSIDGVETITFTYQGVEFLGSEPVSDEENIFNDLSEEEEISSEEEPIIPSVTEEILNEVSVTEEQPTIVLDNSNSDQSQAPESGGDAGNGENNGESGDNNGGSGENGDEGSSIIE